MVRSKRRHGIPDRRPQRRMKLPRRSAIPVPQRRSPTRPAAARGLVARRAVHIGRPEGAAEQPAKRHLYTVRLDHRLGMADPAHSDPSRPAHSNPAAQHTATQPISAQRPEPPSTQRPEPLRAHSDAATRMGQRRPGPGGQAWRSTPHRPGSFPRMAHAVAQHRASHHPCRRWGRRGWRSRLSVPDGRLRP